MDTLAFAAAIAIAMLAADGPTPSGGAMTAAPNAGEERAALLAFLREQLGGSDRDESTKVSLAQVALHPGPERQFIVYVSSRTWCGTGGCTIWVIERGPGGFREVATIAISRPPILVLESLTHGWRDLAVWVAGGGIQPGYQALLPFDGTTYAGNPTVSPARPLRAGEVGLEAIGQQSQAQQLFAGPSFDCALAATRIEKAVCDTPALASLDLQLDDVYRAAWAASLADRASLQDSQAAWLRHRNATCVDGDVRCLEIAYRSRIGRISRSATNRGLPDKK